MCNSLPKQIQDTSFGMLHAHTNYSDGYGRMEDGIEYAQSLGYQALAITDHGTAAGYIEHLEICKQYNIKPILGNELYFKLPNIDKRFHITILSSGNNGYRNIIELNNAAHRNIEKGRRRNFPIMTLDMIEEYCGNNSGITILTGCPASAIHHESLEVAETYIEYLVKYCPSIYAEIMHTMEGEDLISRPLHMVEKFGIRPVYTNDCHMIKPGQGKLQQIMNAMKHGYSFESGSLHMQSKEEAFSIIVDKLPYDLAVESIANVGKIIDASEIPEVKREPTLPDVSGIHDEFYKRLHKRLAEDLEKRSDEKELRQQRFDRELKVLEDKGFIDYFVLVSDIVNFAHSRNITVSARGSCAGSYLSYLLGMSIPDPIDNGLIFERFINYQRDDPPDADLDFPSSRREEVIQYAKEKYNVEQVGTFLTFGHKSLVKAIARGLSNMKIVDIPDDIVINASEMGPNSKEFVDFAKYSVYIQEMYDDLLDTINTGGSHACAVVSLASDIVVPLECHKGETPLVAYVESGAHKTLQLVGGVKIDMLGVEGLSLLDDMYQLSGVKPPVIIENNDPCYTLFDTRNVNGIFQMSSNTGQNIAQQMPVRQMNDITIATSLNRPSALDSGSHIDYLENKIPNDFWPEILQNYMSKSRNVMVFQEDFMYVVGEICANKDATEAEKMAYADNARKIIVPKTTKLLNDPKWIKGNKELKDKFFNGGIAKGISRQKLEEIWQLLSAAARYGFVKAHAASYAWLASQQLWYKYYYPEVYYASQLRNTGATSADLEDNLNFTLEAVREGLKIVPPHIKTSTTNYELNDGKLYLPLHVLKGLGQKSADNIINNKDNFTHLSQLKGLANKTILFNLYKIGALDGLKGDLYDLGVLNVRYKKINHKLPNNKPCEIDIGTSECFIRIKKLGKAQQLPKIDGIETNIPVDNNFHKLHVNGAILAESFSGNDVTIRVVTEVRDPIPELPSLKFAQKELIGYTIPTKNTVDYISYYSGIENTYVGYIVDTFDKESAAGNLLRWYLLTGNIKVFQCIKTNNQKWIENMQKQRIPYGDKLFDIKVGDFVKIETTNIPQIMKCNKIG